MIEHARTRDVNAAVAAMRQNSDGFIRAAGFYTAKAHAPRQHSKTGKMDLVWEREIENLITTAGLNDVLTKYLKNGTTSAAWYVGLVDNAGFSAYNAADTLASHAGWTEWTDYTGNRKAITFGTAAGGVLASSSIATFTVSGATGTETLDGMFVCDVTSGTSGILLSEGAFTGGDAPVANGYVITATYQLTLASA